MGKLRMKIQQLKMEEVETLINETAKREMKNMSSVTSNLSESGEIIRNTYSQTAKSKSGAVLIVKPKDDEVKNSEDTKKEIKNKIYVAKLGVEITKMRKVTRGAVVVEYENKKQANKLKEEVAIWGKNT